MSVQAPLRRLGKEKKIMYLNRLTDDQRQPFLDLCIHAAMTNEDFDRTEKELIKQYCGEMGIAEVRYAPEKPFDEVCVKLAEICSAADTKIIMLNIAGLMLSDNIYDESERLFMRTLAKKLKLGRDDYEETIDFVKQLTAIHANIERFLKR